MERLNSKASELELEMKVEMETETCVPMKPCRYVLVQKGLMSSPMASAMECGQDQRWVWKVDEEQIQASPWGVAS